MSEPTHKQVVEHFRYAYWRDIWTSLDEIRRRRPYAWRNLRWAIHAWFTWRWRVRI